MDPAERAAFAYLLDGSLPRKSRYERLKARAQAYEDWLDAQPFLIQVPLYISTLLPLVFLCLIAVLGVLLIVGLGGYAVIHSLIGVLT